MTITVFLVDDNRTFLAAADAALATLADVLVIGHATCGVDALATIESLRPDVVLLDIGLPDISGIQVGLQLRAWHTPPHIVFVSLHDRAGYSEVEQEVGSAGFVNKADFVTELFPLLGSLADASPRGTQK